MGTRVFVGTGWAVSGVVQATSTETSSVMSKVEIRHNLRVLSSPLCAARSPMRIAVSKARSAIVPASMWITPGLELNGMVLESD